jgi:hypothetical protein
MARNKMFSLVLLTATVYAGLTATAFVGATDVVPAQLNCNAVQLLAVIKPDERIEVPARGFSLLPPQGERWCYRRLTSFGVNFSKIPPFAGPLEKPPSLEEIVATRMFSSIALSLQGLIREGTDIQNPAELKTFVDGLIRENLFFQVVGGLSSPNHRFSILESNVTAENLPGEVCVRFNARAKERGNRQAPALVFVLNLPDNRVCRHPGLSETELVWIGFVERYLASEQPRSDALKREYEPFVQSLQFMTPHASTR